MKNRYTICPKRVSRLLPASSDGRKTVEAEAVDEQMRHVPRAGLARHVAIELLVDDLQLVGR